MAAPKPAGRENQRRRTRKDLLEAADRLLKQGRRPTLEEVAEEAMISRATAYRYFPGIEALLIEAAVDVVFPDAEALFEGDASDDPVGRLERADAAVQKMIVENEAALRAMLSQTVLHGAADADDGGLPIRQNRRTPLIEAALAPARRQFRPSSLDMLQKALALVIGTETQVVCRDVLQLSEVDARQLRRWMIRALVDAAKKG